MKQTKLKYIVVLMVYGSKDVLTFDNAEKALNICTPYWNADGDNGFAILYTNDPKLTSSIYEVHTIEDFESEHIKEIYSGEYKTKYIDKEECVIESLVWQPNYTKPTMIGKYLYQ